MSKIENSFTNNLKNDEIIFKNRDEIAEHIEFKLNIFEKCIKNIKMLKTYPYIDYIENKVFNENSTKSLHEGLLKKCVNNQLNDILIKEGVINTMKK